MGGEYRLKITVRNNLILRAIDEMGFRNVAAFCRHYGLHDQSVSSLVAMRKPPINASGEFCIEAKNLMEALGAAPSDLWTDKQLTMRLSKNSGERVVDEGAIEHLLESNTAAMTLPSPEDSLSEKQNARLVDAMLDTLTPREAKVLRLRNGIGCDDHTFEEVSKQFEVSRARINQIEWKALRKLKHPSRRIAFDVVLGEKLDKIDAKTLENSPWSESIRETIKTLKERMVA